MEVCCDNVLRKAHSQLGSSMATLTWGKPLAQQILDKSTDPVYFALIAIVSISAVSCLLYFVSRLDWGSIIGKRFPGTVNGNHDDEIVRRGDKSLIQEDHFDCANQFDVYSVGSLGVVLEI